MQSERLLELSGLSGMSMHTPSKIQGAPHRRGWETLRAKVADDIEETVPSRHNRADALRNSRGL